MTLALDHRVIAAPALIEGTDAHSADSMPRSGVALQGFERQVRQRQARESAARASASCGNCSRDHTM